MLYNPFEQVTKSSFRELVESGYADFVLQRLEWPDVTEKTGFLLTPYDDKVCYAYLLNEERIVGDIWLYNSVPTPSEPEWHKRENLPFLNPAAFVKENLEPFDASSLVEVIWDFGEETVAKIFLASRLIAKLTVGSCPGWSNLVTKDGPLAQKM